MSNMPLPPITAAELAQLLAAAERPLLVDVREPHEWTSELGHIDGSELIPLRSLAANLSRLVGETREIITVCKSGARAGHAAELLARSGCRVRVLTGGMMAWQAAGLPRTSAP
jgi:rhodanese-related sulfurtransferase